MCRQEQGELKLARESYERALQIAPDLADVIYNLASVLEQQGEKEESERLYVKLLARHPRVGSAWFPVGFSPPPAGDPWRRHRGVQDWPPPQAGLARSAAEPR